MCRNRKVDKLVIFEFETIGDEEEYDDDEGDENDDNDDGDENDDVM